MWIDTQDAGLRALLADFTVVNAYTQHMHA
jgi:hypothetical protein